MKHKKKFRLPILLLILLFCNPASIVKAGPSIPDPNVYQEKPLDSDPNLNPDQQPVLDAPADFKGVTFSKDNIPAENAALQGIFQSGHTNPDSFGKIAAELKLFEKKPDGNKDREDQGTTRSLLPAVFGGIIFISIMLLAVILFSRLRVRKLD